MSVCAVVPESMCIYLFICRCVLVSNPLLFLVCNRAPALIAAIALNAPPFWRIFVSCPQPRLKCILFPSQELILFLLTTVSPSNACTAISSLSRLPCPASPLPVVNATTALWAGNYELRQQQQSVQCCPCGTAYAAPSSAGRASGQAAHQQTQVTEVMGMQGPTQASIASTCNTHTHTYLHKYTHTQTRVHKPTHAHTRMI